MTVATSMKSPGQKPRTPMKGVSSPFKKSPKGTPNAGVKTPKKPGTPLVTKQANGTPKPKTPKGAATPKAGMTSSKPQTPKPSTPNVGQKTPRGTPQVKATPGSQVKNAKSGKTPMKNTPAMAPQGGQKASRKRSASSAGLDARASDPSLGFKTLRIYNLPEMAQNELTVKVRELLEPRGEINSIKCHDNKQGKNVGCVVVVFEKAEDARAAKKLNGVLLGGRHLTIVHSDDRSLPVDNRVVISNVPTDLDDEDVWSLFGSCGKILSIHMNRDWRTKKVQRCFVTFDNKKGVDSALSSSKELRGKQFIVKKAGKDGKMFPIESTVYIVNLSTDAVDNDVRQFVSKCGPVSGVVVVESKNRYAMVHLTNASDVEKALALSGKSLKGKEVKVERHRKSPLYVKPVKESKGAQKVSPKKMKGENGAALPVKTEQSDEDDEDDEDEDDEDDEDMSDNSEGDLLAAFQGKMQKLKSVKKEAKDDDDEEDDDDDEDDEDEDDSEDGEGEDDDDDEEEDEEDDDDDEEDDDE